MSLFRGIGNCCPTKLGTLLIVVVIWTVAWCAVRWMMRRIERSIDERNNRRA